MQILRFLAIFCVVLFAEPNSQNLAISQNPAQNPQNLDAQGRLILEQPRGVSGNTIRPSGDLPATLSPTLPSVNLSLNAPQEPSDLVNTLNIVIIITLLVLAPSLVLVMTSFTRIIIVIGCLRTTMGTQLSLIHI